MTATLTAKHLKPNIQYVLYKSANRKNIEKTNIYENNNLYNSTTCTIHNTRKAKESKTLSKNFVYPPAKMNQVYKELLT